MSRTVLIREAGYTLRYGLVGAAALTVHAVCALLLAASGSPALLAHLAGFAAGFAVSAAGHTIWTFRVIERRWRAVVRFLIATLVAVAGSSAILRLADELLPQSPTSLPAAIISVPVFTYLMARFWAFRDNRDLSR